MLKFLITCIAALFIATVNAQQSVNNSIANALDWHPGSSKKDSCSLCNGHYDVPAIVAHTPHPAPYQQVPITITAKGPVIFRANGTSVLQDHVQIHQPGRLVTANKAVIYHDNKTGKIQKIILTGHVHVQENNRLLVGDTVDYDIEKNTLLINNSIYHIVGSHSVASVTTPVDAWGTAKSLVRSPNETMVLKDATYSTCPPRDPSWIISAKSLTINHEKQAGYARDIVLRFKKIPILYSPYYSFSLSSKRKSGFLPPAIGTATNQGFYFTLPYYWNIAPNYDLLLTPEWYSLRGLQINGNFRYLTEKSDGHFYMSYLPNDWTFGQFRRSTLSNFANTTITPELSPYITALQSQNNSRAFLDFQNDVQFNNQWAGKFYARYVTDPYFTQNFQSAFLQQNSNQLPSFAEFNYLGAHWNDTLLMQTYQTLHQVNQIETPAQNQYTRLPEFDVNATYPQFASQYDFNLSAQAVQFDYNSSYYPFTYQRPLGGRIHLQPSISRPLTWSSGYITPKLTIDNTSYFSQLQTTAWNVPRQNYEASRTLPIADIDTGLYFDQSVAIGRHQYIQTLEPRVFYLYTPYLNQNSYPNFDTQLLPFSTNYLYALNQYTGFDRLQNANQVSIGLTSRLLRASNASNIVSAQLGFIDYFTMPQVTLLPTDQITRRSISPITGSLSWTPNAYWDITTQAAWDTVMTQINNAQFGAQYNIDSRRIILINYQFTHGNANTPFNAAQFSPNSSLLTTGLVWPLIKRWNFFGYDYYDLTHSRSQSQYYGLAYDTCCWALRFIISNNYNGTLSINNGAVQQNQYTTNYYFQFLLKGLGSVGSGGSEGLLTGTLPNFQDSFSNHGHYSYGTTDSGF